MNTIEVFKTNVVKRRDAQQLLKEMTSCFPNYKINFDLEDRDKILRVENERGSVKTSSIITLLQNKQVKCEVLN